jgi:hypothetical protein
MTVSMMVSILLSGLEPKNHHFQQVSFLTSASFAIASFRILEASLAFDFAVCFVAIDGVLIGGVWENSLSIIVELCQSLEGLIRAVGIGIKGRKVCIPAGLAIYHR